MPVKMVLLRQKGGKYTGKWLSALSIVHTVDLHPAKQISDKHKDSAREGTCSVDHCYCMYVNGPKSPLHSVHYTDYITITMECHSALPGNPRLKSRESECTRVQSLQREDCLTRFRGPVTV